MSLLSTPQQQPSPLQFPNQQQQHHPQQLFLFTKDKSPASYSTKWEDLHPGSRKVLLRIQVKILEHRDESQRLDRSCRLFDSKVSNDAFDVDAARVLQELGGIDTSMGRQKAVLQALMTMVKDMIRSTEVAVRSIVMLQPANPMGPVIGFYSGLPKKPSVFMQQTVIRFEKYLGECRQWIEESEQLIFSDSEQKCSNFNSQLQSLPKVLSNVHDFFIHVAAKVESIHHYIESMRAAYLADQRRKGEGNNPFLEADRRETAREEADARRWVHPTIHLTALPQQSTQTAGQFSSSVTPSGSSAAPQTPFGTSSTPSARASSGLFATPTSAPASSPALLRTHTSSVFTASGASPQTPLPNPASPTSTPLVTEPAATGGTTLLPTPFASGAATRSGASIGNEKPPKRAKLRTVSRR